MKIEDIQIKNKIFVLKYYCCIHEWIVPQYKYNNAWLIYRLKNYKSVVRVWNCKHFKIDFMDTQLTIAIKISYSTLFL